MGCEEGEEGEEGRAAVLRRRIQHQAEPYPPEAPEVAEADLGKRYNQAHDIPSGYPQPARVTAGDFRRGPITGDHAAYSPGYSPSARPVPVPSATLSAAAITRPLMTDGRAAPSAEGR